MNSYILDTNLFFNMEAGLGLGNKTEDVVITITKGIRSLTNAKKAQFFVPPKIVEEFLTFFDDKEQPFIQDFLKVISVKSPHIHDINLPAAVFYQIVDDIRTRSYRGLTIGDESIQQAGKTMAGREFPQKKDFEMAIGPVTKNFRDRYRQATRFGFLDSVADLDLIMLAKEQDAMLVSADEGVIRWGRVFGIKEISLPVFGTIIKESL
jgi:RNA ligase partner protein